MSWCPDRPRKWTLIQTFTNISVEWNVAMEYNTIGNQSDADLILIELTKLLYEVFREELHNILKS